MPIKLPSFRSRRDAYPPDLWTKCPSCSEMLFNKQLDKALRVCPSCGHHFRLSAGARLDLLLDAGSFEERDPGLVSVDVLGFVDQKPYPDRLAAAQVSTGLRDAAVWGFGKVDGTAVAICVLDFGFMGGSMGAVVGEKVARAAEGALERRVPLIVVSASGGARMQEGTISLMQLAKTMAAIERLRAAEVPFISIMSDPTTGGVFASYAAVGDVNLAEPNALIGFAGARVSAGTIAAELPPGFQRSEFLFEHGFVDRVVTRAELRDELARLLRYLVPPARDVAVAEATDAAAFSFRPLSVLSGIRDRVLPDDLARLSNGRSPVEPGAGREPPAADAGGAATGTGPEGGSGGSGGTGESGPDGSPAGSEPAPPSGESASGGTSEDPIPELPPDPVVVAASAERSGGAEAS
jgi:acetyl-CoA carboxylase carboxyl transferase subunit beta